MGSGKSYTTFYRQNDAGLGRWFSVDPKAEFMPWQSPYSSMDNNPIGKTDPKGDCITCPTMAVGGIIGVGVGLYDLTQQHGGFFNAIEKLAEGNGKAWIHLSTTTGTGVALGSGVGLVGSVGIATGSNLLDQTIQKDIYLDRDFSKIDPVETVVAGSFAAVGIGGGKIVEKLLKPVTSKGTALSLFLEKTTFPKNSPATVVGANLGLGAASAVGEKTTTFLTKELLGEGGSDNSMKSEDSPK